MTVQSTGWRSSWLLQYVWSVRSIYRLMALTVQTISSMSDHLPFRSNSRLDPSGRRLRASAFICYFWRCFHRTKHCHQRIVVSHKDELSLLKVQWKEPLALNWATLALCVRQSLRFKRRKHANWKRGRSEPIQFLQTAVTLLSQRHLAFLRSTVFSFLG